MAGLQTSQYPSYHTLRLYGHSLHEKVFDPESGISNVGDTTDDALNEQPDLSFTSDLPRLEPSAWDRGRLSGSSTLTSSSSTATSVSPLREPVKNIPAALSVTPKPKPKVAGGGDAAQKAGLLSLQDYVTFINPQIRPIPEELIYAEGANGTTPPPDTSRPEMYKTVMCEAWLLTAFCGYGENCKFAHGLRELRKAQDPVIPSKYKTKVCFKYASQGICPHGNACLFVHPLPPGYTVYNNMPTYC
uniref:C3H1-type domain-containing protein n=1 Tax=Panagrellus redivivus TaxID=6233 RepID=A0A7E4ZRB5_PANRE